jgi:hypothetical protein
MDQIECWGCEQTFDKSQIKYFMPFAGTQRDPNEPAVLEIGSAVTDEPQPGALPYCPKCLKGILAK